MPTMKCKYCGSKSVVKFGTYKGVQRYYCKHCKRSFMSDRGITKKQFESILKKASQPKPVKPKTTKPKHSRKRSKGTLPKCDSRRKA